jgi:hypothetical protein
VNDDGSFFGSGDGGGGGGGGGGRGGGNGDDTGDYETALRSLLPRLARRGRTSVLQWAALLNYHRVSAGEAKAKRYA